MIRHLPDTNVFSRIFKGDLNVANFVANLDVVIDATVYIECLQGSKSNLEKRMIKKVLENFPLLQITPKISQQSS